MEQLLSEFIKRQLSPKKKAAETAGTINGYAVPTASEESIRRKLIYDQNKQLLEMQKERADEIRRESEAAKAQALAAAKEWETEYLRANAGMMAGMVASGHSPVQLQMARPEGFSGVPSSLDELAIKAKTAEYLEPYAVKLAKAQEELQQKETEMKLTHEREMLNTVLTGLTNLEITKAQQLQLQQRLSSLAANQEKAKQTQQLQEEATKARKAKDDFEYQKSVKREFDKLIPNSLIPPIPGLPMRKEIDPKRLRVNVTAFIEMMNETKQANKIHKMIAEHQPDEQQLKKALNTLVNKKVITQWTADALMLYYYPPKSDPLWKAPSGEK